MERSILFNNDMVKAILEGKKTVTRRLVKKDLDIYGNLVEFRQQYPDGSSAKTRMPYNAFISSYAPYKKGDNLYVKETWAKFLGAPSEGGFLYRYKASYEGEMWDDIKCFKWSPSIHMPKDAARIWLCVTDVYLQRLNDMTVDDALHEGADISQGLKDFINIWNSSLKKDDVIHFSWDSNPWVWVIEFELSRVYQQPGVNYISWNRIKPGRYISDDHNYNIVNESPNSWTLFSSVRKDWSSTHCTLNACKEEAEKFEMIYRNSTCESCRFLSDPIDGLERFSYCRKKKHIWKPNFRACREYERKVT